MNRATCQAAVLLGMTVLAGFTAAVGAESGAPTPTPNAAQTTRISPTVVLEKRGYWWKREAPNDPAAEDERLLPAPPSEAELLALHPKDVERLIENYREFALWKMSPESVLWYYQLQDFARRRSRAFMNVTSVVMLGHPELNMQTVYPTNPPGQAARVAQRQASINQRLLAERDDAALVMLVSEGCQYCEAMRAVLRYFQERYGWAIREIDVEQRPEAVARFGTNYTPTTLVIFRNSSQWMPVSVGVETLEALEEGLYRALRLARGETAPDQYTLQEFEDGGLYDPRRELR